MEIFSHSDVAILVKGSAMRAEYYWWRREIGTYQAARDWLRGRGFETWKRYTPSTCALLARGRRGLGTTTGRRLDFLNPPHGWR
ncbi:MAG: hypothetical protein LM577_03510 [Thermoproteaceae archaeon]|nr:hypothetical protein [Thermoproteaceae archaeon]